MFAATETAAEKTAKLEQRVKGLRPLDRSRFVEVVSPTTERAAWFYPDLLQTKRGGVVGTRHLDLPTQMELLRLSHDVLGVPLRTPSLKEICLFTDARGILSVRGYVWGNDILYKEERNPNAYSLRRATGACFVDRPESECQYELLLSEPYVSFTPLPDAGDWRENARAHARAEKQIRMEFLGAHERELVATKDRETFQESHGKVYLTAFARDRRRAEFYVFGRSPSNGAGSFSIIPWTDENPKA